MRRTLKSTLAALVAVCAFGAIAAGNGFAFHPSFLTQSGKELLVAGLSGRTLVYYRRAGVLVIVHCEKDLFDGFALPRSPLIHRALLLVHGKCILLVNGMTSTCIEPIHFRNSLHEIGLASSTNHKVVILSAPSEGTEVVKFTCNGEETTLSGAVVGEIPEINAKLENQYNKPLSELEVVYLSEGGTENQKLTEIFLLGAQMTGVHLSAEGLFGGPAAIEYTEIIKGDGLLEICTKEAQACP